MTRTLALVANAKDGTISTFDISDSTLKRLAVSPCGAGVGTFAVDEEALRLYAGVKGDDDGAQVVTMSLDPESGQLTETSRRAVDDSQTYLDLTPDRSRLLGASYSGGYGQCWPVGPGGALGTPGVRVEHPNLHCVVAADDNTAHFVSLGADLVSTCRISGNGDLVEMSTSSAPQGSGPRHLILTRDRSTALVVTEFSGEVLRYSVGPDATLTPLDTTPIFDPDAGLTHSRYGADPRAEHLIWGADVHLAQDERSLWATERTEGTICVVRRRDDGSLGALTDLQRTEPQPRGFGVSPDGTLVLVTGELSTTVTLYEVQDDATLVQVDQQETGNGANWVRFVTLH